jgi:hypothetical protein
MRHPLALSIALVFCALSALHWYWVLGGVSSGMAAVPEVNGRPAFQPGRLSTAAVALALAAAALTVLVCGGVVRTRLPEWIPFWATVALGTLFVLRAVGEFHLVGFFKSVRGTPFARWDTWLFSPLCVALGLGCLWVARLARAASAAP